MPPPPPPLWVRVLRGTAWTVAVLAAVGGAVTWAASLVLQAEPAVAVESAVNVQDVDRALALLRANDPRTVPQGVELSVVATQRDLDLLLDHAARRRQGVRGRVLLEAGTAELVGSLEQRVGPWTRWVNVYARVAEGTPLPVLREVRVGAVPVPLWAARRLFPAAVRRLGADAVLPVVAEAITGVRVAPNRLQVRYRWRPASVSRLLAALVAPAEMARLRDYHERLAALVAGADTAPRPLMGVLAPLGAMAAQRAVVSGDAGAELRGALLTLALYVTDRPLGAMVPAARTWPALRRHPVVLGGREDLAKHFLVSALLVVEGSSPLAQAVGVYKELQDSRPGGSGFSFADLAADLAGTRFGELGQRNPQWLAGRVAAGLEEGEFFPFLTGIPEGVDSATFDRVYGGLAGAGTRQMRGELGRRVDTLALYR